MSDLATQDDSSMDDTIRETLAEINNRSDEPEVAVEAEATADEVKAGRARDESGRFAAKAPEAATAAPAVDDPVVTEAPPVRKAPSSWKKEVVEKHWGALPPDVQAYVEEREGQFHKGLEQYRNAAQFAQQMERAVSPYMATIQGLGVTPDVAVNKLLATDHALRYGSQEQKIRMVQDLARQYGVDLGQATQELPRVDPTIYQLQQQVGQLRNYLTTQEQTQIQREQQALNSEIASFAADPAHTHFESVREDMAALLQAGRAKDLRDAYDMAVRANPVTFAAWQAEQQAKQREEAAKATAKAKQAASANVIGKAAPPAAAQIGSMDDTLKATYRRLMGTV